MVKFSCPACKAVLQVAADHSEGNLIPCTNCGRKLKVALMASGTAGSKPRAAPSGIPSPVQNSYTTPPALAQEGYFALEDAVPDGVNVPNGAETIGPEENLAPFAPVLSVSQPRRPEQLTSLVSRLHKLSKGWLRPVGKGFRLELRTWLPLTVSFGALLLAVLSFRGSGSEPSQKLEQEIADIKAVTRQIRQLFKEKPVPAPAKPTAQQIYENALKSVVWIHNPGIGFGSGALVNAEEKLVVTNYHVVAANAPVAAKMLGKPIEDALTRGDKQVSGKPFKVYDIQMVRGIWYQIDLESREFDAYLEILDSEERVLGRDDDSGGNLNARIRFTPPLDGKYRIRATTFDGGLGKFMLKISQIEVGAVAKAATLVLVNFPEYQGGKVILDRMHYFNVNRADQRAIQPEHRATVLDFRAAKDLALVKLSHLPKGVSPLRFSKQTCKPGDLVHSIGNPGGSGALWVYTSGTVRTYPFRKEWRPRGLMFNLEAVIIETQSPVNRGDSGGPLLNDAGELVGVTQGFNQTLDHDVNIISIFVDIEEVRSLLRHNGKTWLEK